MYLRTFPDTSSPEVLLEKCSSLCQSLAKEVTEQHILVCTDTVGERDNVYNNVYNKIHYCSLCVYG